MKLGNLVLIEWEDSCAVAGWREHAEIATFRDSICASVGWVVHINRRRVVVAPHIGCNNTVELEQTNGHMIIPRSAVRRVKVLKVPAGIATFASVASLGPDPSRRLV